MADQEKQTTTRRQRKTGSVTSAKGDKTIRVEILDLVKHPVYGKYIRRRTKLAVHDPLNDAKLGDVVEIGPCRRMSKTKNWRLLRIVRRSEAAMTTAGKEE